MKGGFVLKYMRAQYKLKWPERAVPVSKNSTKIISSCMFIAFVDLPCLSIHEFLNVRKRTPHTSKNKDEQRKATTIITYNLKSDK